MTVFSASRYCGRGTNKGAFIIFPTGIAGVLSGDVTLNLGASLSGDVFLRINTTGRTVDQTVTINLSDAMREAQERLDRSRTVDVPVRRIG